MRSHGNQPKTIGPIAMIGIGIGIGKNALHLIGLDARGAIALQIEVTPRRGAVR